MRSAIDWEMDWVDERVAGGDRLREEWQQSCKRGEAPEDVGGRRLVSQTASRLVK